VTCSGTVSNPGGDGYGTGAEANTTITVQPGASVTGGANDGLFIANDNTVNNSGTITGLAGYGINASGTLTVVNSGLIRGNGNDGIIAGDAFITNRGSIIGADEGINVDNLTMTNYDTVTGVGFGVQTGAGLARIVNYGTITGGAGVGDAGVYGRSVDIVNVGTISGRVGVQAGIAGGSVLTNAGLINGSFASIDFTSSGGDTLTFLPGSRLIGSVELGTGARSTVNIHTGRDVGWIITFGACGCGGLVANNSVVNFIGGAPGVVSGDRIATLDATAFGIAGKSVSDFTGLVSSIVGARVGEFTQASAGGAATAFAPAPAASGTAFALMPEVGNAYASAAPVANASMVDRQSGTAVWSKGFAGFRRHPGDDVMLASTSTGFGGALGIDGQFNSTLRIGAFIGAGMGKIDVARKSQDIETDYVFGGIYGRNDFGGRFVDFTVTAGHSSNSSERLIANNLAGGGLQSAKAKYQGWFASPEIGYGVSLPAGDGITIVPSVRLRYVAGQFDGYSETGSEQGLSVGRRTFQSLEQRIEIGFMRSALVGDRVFTSQVTAGGIAVERLGDSSVDAVLIGQSISFSAPGNDFTAGAFAGIGTAYRFTNSASLFSSLDFAFMTDKSVLGSLKAGARVAF